MIEDRLNREQRIRLEAISQANARLAPAFDRLGESITELLREAKRIAAYINDGTLDAAVPKPGHVAERPDGTGWKPRQ